VVVRFLDRILCQTKQAVYRIKTNVTWFCMVLNLWLDLHDELIQLDDLYKERHNNINDSLSRLHSQEKPRRPKRAKDI